MNTPTNAATGTTNTTPPIETSTPTMNTTDTDPTTNAADSTEVVRSLTERILAVVSIDGEGTATPDEVKALMAEAAEIFKPFGNQYVSYRVMDIVFTLLIQRLCETANRLKFCEHFIQTLCEGQQELRKASRGGSTAAIASAINRLTVGVERQADASEDQAASGRETAENTGNLYNSVECWGEAQSLGLAQAAGLLNEAGKERLRRLLDL